MNMIIHQTINIGQLRVNSVSNSSVLQIGSAGSIQALSQLYNTGGYTGPAPQLGETGGAVSSPLALVPLPSPNPT